MHLWDKEQSWVWDLHPLKVCRIFSASAWRLILPLIFISSFWYHQVLSISAWWAPVSTGPATALQGSNKLLNTNCPTFGAKIRRFHNNVKGDSMEEWGVETVIEGVAAGRKNWSFNSNPADPNTPSTHLCGRVFWSTTAVKQFDYNISSFAVLFTLLMLVLLTSTLYWLTSTFTFAHCSFKLKIYRGAWKS